MTQQEAYSDLVQSLKPEDILKTFPDVAPITTTNLDPRPTSKESADDKQLFDGQDAEQIRLMEEVCIVVDWNDTPVGAGSKKTCHLMTNINRGLLHRAFSVFLFDENNRLLLQKRADEKITFANMWTNTCCSHPLAIPSELGSSSLDEISDLTFSMPGAKNAARRKLEHELGIPVDAIPLEKYKFLTRIHYASPSTGPWGEHEVDYIFIVKANVPLDININEIGDSRYVSVTELKEMFKDECEY